jgi:hypothetical protein
VLGYALARFFGDSTGHFLMFFDTGRPQRRKSIQLRDDRGAGMDSILVQ